MMSTVKLINHASAKVRIDDVSIISDPWYEGSVFHKGWKLLHELTVEETKDHLQNTDYIYVSLYLFIFILPSLDLSSFDLI